ncbi:hypothetical protein AVEN_24171-1 [Araneus ventricosus]|uniref:Uncharacterized protein n=1 Tax=Araneus ventricosus TaxID=182803 RepID=A0A4Y2HSD2_ARAVE|nr:hypothetical protein AVEN_24171-1 [Araneus ventricosus]
MSPKATPPAISRLGPTRCVKVLFNAMPNHCPEGHQAYYDGGAFSEFGETEHKEAILFQVSGVVGNETEREPNVLRLVWCGSLVRGVPAQVPSSSFDRGSKGSFKPGQGDTLIKGSSIREAVDVDGREGKGGIDP